MTHARLGPKSRLARRWAIATLPATASLITAALWSASAHASPWATALTQPTGPTVEDPDTTIIVPPAPVPPPVVTPERPPTTSPTTSPTTVVVVQSPPAAPPPAEPEEESRFDDGFDLYLVPGTINMPFGGEDDVDYFDSFDPGYQWGLGLGYFSRGESAFALGVGGFFDHAILNRETRDITDLDESSENIFRVGLELRPGVVVGERVFLNLPIRGGYSAYVRHGTIGTEVELDVSHGPHVGVGGGLDIAIYRGLYIGTAAGVDFQFFRAGRDFNMYTVAWRALLGYRF